MAMVGDKSVARLEVSLNTPAGLLTMPVEVPTGFVPVTMAAYELSRKQGFYAKYPGYEIAVHQLIFKQPTGDTRGIRLLHLRNIRTIIDEELESVWGGKKTPMEALNTAVSRGNAVLTH